MAKSDGQGKSRPKSTSKSQRHTAAAPKAKQKREAEARERGELVHTSHETSRFLSGARIDPRRITGRETVPDLIDATF
ncbi:MAG TPA: hypothetical protein VFJ96_03505, partial [Gemmatimonadaceae bacterium]|nr:hypothetical protein [Gemmatimonadaceae bacterium]